MEPRDLVKVWDAPDNSKLNPKQWSIRLPIHVAAKINALCELYPRKTKTEIISDLLATALAQLVEALPGGSRGEAAVDAGEQVGAAGGMRGRFDALTRQYIEEMDGEKDLK
jgi:hypothetical protein